jgi:predicted DNA-binding transcriptional regulator YafY
MPKYTDYGLFQDLLSLVLWLQGSVSGVSIQDIMARFRVSRRTAERMRNAVGEVFPGDLIEIPDGKRKFFKLRSKNVAKVALSTISDKELSALHSAADALKKRGMGPKAELLESLSLKLRGSMNLSTSESANLEDALKFEGLALKPAPQLVIDPRIISTIRDGLMSFHCVKISYKFKDGGSAEYAVIPLGILYGERNHYLVARQAENPRGRAKHFILSHILKAELMPEDYEEDKDFSLEKHAARSFGAFQEKPFDVEWRFSPAAAEDASRMLFHPSQTLRSNHDGSLTVKFRAGGRLEMAWHLYTWGDQVKVLRPKDFWETLPPGWARKKKARK